MTATTLSLQKPQAADSMERKISTSPEELSQSWMGWSLVVVAKTHVNGSESITVKQPRSVIH